MSTADIVIIIGAGSGAIVSIIGAVFAGLHAGRSAGSAADAKTAARVVLDQKPRP